MSSFHIGAIATIGLCFGVATSDEERIDRITAMESFTISVDRMDLGFFHNMQLFRFTQNGADLHVTHEHLVGNWQDSTLQNTPLKSEASFRIASVLKDLKRFETEESRKYRRACKKNGMWDFINLYVPGDTVVLVDPENKVLPALFKAINQSRN